jgi:hypothetical protein
MPMAIHCYRCGRTSCSATCKGSGHAPTRRALPWRLGRRRAPLAHSITFHLPCATAAHGCSSFYTASPAARYSWAVIAPKPAIRTSGTSRPTSPISNRFLTRLGPTRTMATTPFSGPLIVGRPLHPAGPRAAYPENGALQRWTAAKGSSRSAHQATATYTTCLRCIGHPGPGGGSPRPVAMPPAATRTGRPNCRVADPRPADRLPENRAGARGRASSRHRARGE